MDTATPDPQDPINVLTAVLSAPLRVDEEQDLAALERRIGDPEAARRVLDAVRAAAFVEEEDLAPGMALDYQVRAFGELHGREHGGTWDPACPIDLDSIGRRIPLYATQPLAMLASIGGGRAPAAQRPVVTAQHARQQTPALRRRDRRAVPDHRVDHRQPPPVAPLVAACHARRAREGHGDHLRRSSS